MFKNIEKTICATAILNFVVGLITGVIVLIVAISTSDDLMYPIAIGIILESAFFPIFMYGFGVLIGEVKRCCELMEESNKYVKGIYDVEYYRMEKDEYVCNSEKQKP